MNKCINRLINILRNNLCLSSKLNYFEENKIKVKSYKDQINNIFSILYGRVL